VASASLETKGGNKPSGLYPRLMGSAWSEVHETVRRAHASSEVLRGEGLFRVVHGEGVLARVLVRLLRIPEATEGGRVHLKVTSQKHGERWLRTFGERRLVSTQREGTGGLLVERRGFLEFRFRLEVADGAICYRQEAFGMRFGPVYVPMPFWISPQVAAREGPGKSPDQSSVVVTVFAPITGLLFKYEGEIQIKG